MRAILGHLGLMPLAKPLTTEEGRQILERDHYRCRYCGLDGRSNFDNSLVMSVDFIRPRAQKGAKDADNLICACRACNLIKGKKVFNNFEEAKSYVVKRRSELQKDWAARMEKLQPKHMTASR